MKNSLMFQIVNLGLVAVMDFLAFWDWLPFFKKVNEVLNVINPSLDTIAKLAAILTSAYIFYRMNKTKNIRIDKDQILGHD